MKKHLARPLGGLVMTALIIGGGVLSQAPSAQAADESPHGPSRLLLPVLFRAPCPTDVPAGWTQVSSGVGSGHGQLGAHLSMALDGCQDPMLAYAWLDPNGDNDFADNTLYFRRYLRGTGVFSNPIAVDIIGDIASSAPSRQISLARDAKTGAIGIAYQTNINGVEHIKLAISITDGQTWQKEVLPLNDVLGADSPALAMAQGNIYVAYKEANYGGHYLSRSGYSGSFTDTMIPVLPNSDPYNFTSAPFVLKTDASGQPALAYMMGADQGSGVSYNVTLGFWRPNSQPVTVFDSNGVQDDAPTLSLAFDGLNPRIAALLHRSNNWPYESNLYVAISGNAGTTFGPVAQVPMDGGNAFGSYTSLAINTSGGGAIVTHSGGGNNDNTQCGMPKLSTSSDLSHWATCGITAADDPTKDYYDGLHNNLAINAFDKLMIAMEADKNGVEGGGILFYRTP